MGRPIYVEISIRAPREAVWMHTQRPELHERWDLRFTSIKYLSRERPADPQRFCYTTRIGFGLEISGTGESVGSHEQGGVSTSALKFVSDDPKSLILCGSGYWKYVDTGDHVRFLTLYDYRTRFGLAGRLVDGGVFRPLLGWATAWSFDRLRLWVEQGWDPGLTAAAGLAHVVARALLALSWIYQGAVPKLLTMHPDEILLAARVGVPAGAERGIVSAAGVIEVVLGLALILAWRARWLCLLSAAMLGVLIMPVLVRAPDALTRAFNPASLTFAMLGLSLVDWLVVPYSPSASQCARVSKKE